MANADQQPAAEGQGSGDSYADPEDADFGRAAAEKEEVADRAESEGRADELDDEDAGDRPRPGAKAEPQ